MTLTRNLVKPRRRVKKRRWTKAWKETEIGNTGGVLGRSRRGEKSRVEFLWVVRRPWNPSRLVLFLFSSARSPASTECRERSFSFSSFFFFSLSTRGLAPKKDPVMRAKHSPRFLRDCWKPRGGSHRDK